jgi:hypothetical protein
MIAPLFTEGVATRAAAHLPVEEQYGGHARWRMVSGPAIQFAVEQRPS